MPDRNAARAWKTPSEDQLGLRRIGNDAGLSIKLLPNGCLFAIEHEHAGAVIRVTQVAGSPLEGGIGRLLIRVAREPVDKADPGQAAAMATHFEAVGPRAQAAVVAAGDRVAWCSEVEAVSARVTLLVEEGRAVEGGVEEGGVEEGRAVEGGVEEGRAAWQWQVDLVNRSSAPVALDSILIQDLGLASPGFLANNEAYASQYTDHHVAQHPVFGPVVMSRQNLAQGGRNPWIAHGCLEGAAGFATDALQVFGPAWRDGAAVFPPCGTPLPSCRLQHEMACAAIQSPIARLPAGGRVRWRFFALYLADHPAASSDADLAAVEQVAWSAPALPRDAPPVQAAPEKPQGTPQAAVTSSHAPVRSILQNASVVRAEPLGIELDRLFPVRRLEERDGEDLWSFFVPAGTLNRHVVLHDKECRITRRHGSLLRSGRSMLPDEDTLCATVWMHGIFGAQLTIGNTSLHKLLSVSRDPYNITRASGLRMLVDTGCGFQLLAVPSAFEMGPADARWIYRAAGRIIVVQAAASAAEPAMHWRISIEGSPCRLLVAGHVVLGERELEESGSIELHVAAGLFTFRPAAGGPWRARYPQAVFHLVTSRPDCVEAAGGDELLYEDGQPREGACFAVRTRPVAEWSFAIVGSLTRAEEAARLAAKYRAGVEDDALLQPAAAWWQQVTRGLRIAGVQGRAEAVDASLPWLVHDAMIHLTVPHGLEQYTGAAWGTRDVCQGPVELLLALEHDAPVKDILRIVFAQQYEQRGDWPQWFMLEPYSAIQDRDSHGDVIVWPLKALNDYVEATGDIAFLAEPVAWRDDRSLARTARADSVSAHVERLIHTARQRFIPGTSLIRYGEGDWNDSLQPVDAHMRDWMVSAWTVALLYQQLVRYAAILVRAGSGPQGAALAELAAEMREDFNRLLIRDGVVAGYGLFDPGRRHPELLIHPGDTRTGLRYSLLPMTRSIIGGMFTAEQARRHLDIIREHLLFPDGVRLIDRPVAYRGGPQKIFRRAESSSFFGREIGLMYVHAHLRYGEALAAMGEADALWEALLAANPVAVTEQVAQALPRQRNAYFSSSDAAFRDRYEAAAGWDRLRAGTVPVEGGWRIYSSGPGLYINLLVGHAFGRRRRSGVREQQPLLPAALQALALQWRPA